jgi:hypothetical protein
MAFTRDAGELRQKRLVRGIEVADPEIGNDPQRPCMAHAAVGGDEAAAFELSSEPVCRRQRAAEQDGEG